MALTLVTSDLILGLDYGKLTGTIPTWNQNTTGNADTATLAASATILATARNINGEPFDGSANITIVDATKLPLAGGTLTGALSGTSATFSGSVNISKQSDSDYLALKIENLPITASNTSSGYIGFYSNPNNGASNTISTGKIYGKFDSNSYADARLTFSTVTDFDVYEDVMTLKYGNVGIGNNSPNNKFVVRGLSSDATGSSDNVAQFEGPSGTNGFQVFVNDPNNNTGIQAKNGDSFLINPHGGNVGIGTTSPSAKLEVASTTGNQLRLAYNSTYYWDIERDSITGRLSFTDGATGGERLTVLTGGNVGIGTDSPSRLLDVDGVQGWSSSDIEVAVINPTPTGTDFSLKNSSGVNVVRFDGRPNGDAYFNTGGNVGIGTDSPDTKLHVNNGASNVSAIFESTDGISAIQFVDPNGVAEIGNSGNDLLLMPGGIEKARIASTGEVLMPFQPSVLARKNASYNETSGENVVTDWIAHHNIGNDFVAATGLFTCPKAGRYLCTFSAMSGQTSGDVQFRILRNSTLMIGSNSMAEGGAWRQTTITGVIDCAVGDILKPLTYSSTSSSTPLVYGGQYSSLSFHFLG